MVQSRARQVAMVYYKIWQLSSLQETRALLLYLEHNLNMPHGKKMEFAFETNIMVLEHHFQQLFRISPRESLLFLASCSNAVDWHWYHFQIFLGIYKLLLFEERSGCREKKMNVVATARPIRFIDRSIWQRLFSLNRSTEISVTITSNDQFMQHD
jgi:hypothetical protein